MLILVILILLAVLYTFLFSLIATGYWFILWIFLGILCSIITFLLFVLINNPIFRYTKHTNKYKHFVMRQAVAFLFICLNIKVEVIGKENVPKGTFVYVSNHKSNTDVMSAYYACNTVMSACAKKSLSKIPLMKGIMKGMEVVFIDREDNREGVKALLHGIELVKEGYPMIIFPEGGIKSREVETMTALRPGAYKLATKADAPILPATIIGSSKIYKKKFYKHVKVKVILHKPIYKEEYETMNTTELGNYIAQIVDGPILNEIKK